MLDLISKFPIKQQMYGDDCSVCVIWCTLRYFGFRVSYRKLYDFVNPPTEPDKGVTGEQIMEILKNFGIENFYEKSNISTLKWYTNNNFPVIVSIQHQKERNKKWKYTKKYGHYVIVLKVKKHKVKFMDPNYGKIETLSIKKFKKRWHDGNEKDIDQYPAIICGHNEKIYDINIIKTAIKLSKRDKKVFFDEISNPSKPNKTLKDAALKYKKNGTEVK